MTLSEELTWRGMLNQTTYENPSAIDNGSITFYWGVDPSADSMTVGHLAAAMLVKCFIKHGHRPVLLVGGATGLIGDPDGKAQERDTKSKQEIDHNKAGIVAQYHKLFDGAEVKVVDNYDWFADINYLDFLREVGKHVPMRQMLGRDFVQSRLGETGSGISYAEFSYVLIQAYDFLKLHEDEGVSLQLCGSDQWGNSVAGVDLIRRKTGAEAHVLSTPLIINRQTGKKFGKTEEGAVWLDPSKTTPTSFYQFWINVDDDEVENYIKIFTELNKDQVDAIMTDHRQDPRRRLAQTMLAEETTRLVHGEQETTIARDITDYLTGRRPVAEAQDSSIEAMRKEVPSVKAADNGLITEALVAGGLASSLTDARRLIADNAISVNGSRVDRQNFESADFQNGRLIVRRGKAFKDSILVELG